MLGVDFKKQLAQLRPVTKRGAGGFAYHVKIFASWKNVLDIL